MIAYDKCNAYLYFKYLHRLKEYRDKAAQGGTPVLYLNAGDTYTGTPWFTLYRDKIVTEFLNLLKPDAIVSVYLSIETNIYKFPIRTIV